MEPVIAISRPEGALDVARCADSDADGSIVMEAILKQIVVVTNRRDTTNIEDNVLGRRNMCRCQMALDGISSVMLEETYAIGVDVGYLTDVE